MPWVMLVDALMGAVDLVRWARGRRALPAVSGRDATMEARLAGAAVSAVRDFFDRDRDRLEQERERLEADRARADRVLKLELIRQAGDREIGRLRVVTAVASASWLGSLALALAGAEPAGVFARVMSGIGWVFILGSLAASLVARRHVARVLGRMDDRTSTNELASLSGAAALWGLVAGLASIMVGRL
jgi:hypothetical protein